VTGTLAAPLAEALEAVVRVHEAAKAMNAEHGFEIFTESAMPDAMAAGAMGILRSDPAVIAAMAEALLTLDTYRPRVAADEPGNRRVADRHSVALLDALLGKP